MKVTKSALGIGNNQLFALKDEQGVITNNRDEVIKVAEKFYRKLYSSNVQQNEDPNTEVMNTEVPCVNASEIKKALKGMSRGKAGGEDGLTIDLIKDAGNFLIENLLYFLQNVCKLALYQKNGKMQQ